MREERGAPEALGELEVPVEMGARRSRIFAVEEWADVEVTEGSEAREVAAPEE